MSRVVVVTGGGTGIGRAVAGRFTADGDTVVLIGRRTEVLKAAAADLGADPRTGEVDVLTADLAEPAEVEQVATALRERYGRVDVLVHSAGGNVLLRDRPAADSPVADVAGHWLGNFRANVLTAVLLTEAVRDIVSGPDGRIVFVSSIAAYRGSGSGSYAGAKAALHPYCYDLAAALGPAGVTVNVVAPGFIEDTEFFGDRLTEQRRATLARQALNGRAGTPADVADAVHWLSAPASRHVTGQIIQVNGGAERGR